MLLRNFSFFQVSDAFELSIVKLVLVITEFEDANRAWKPEQVGFGPDRDQKITAEYGH